MASYNASGFLLFLSSSCLFLQPWLGGGGGGSSEVWKRRLSRRLSRLSNLSAFNEDDTTMLDQVRQSMRSGSGKR